ncbi:MAG: hypothetical protein AAF242_18000, partial [Bacteroidota bacterium]
MQISSKGKYYGARETELSLDQVVLYQYDYDIELTPWHYHENPYFMFVLRGQMVDFNKRTKSLLPAGSLMLNNWQEQHYGLRHSPQATGFHVEFERSWFSKYGIDIKTFEGSHKIDHPLIQLLMSKIYYEFLVSDEHSTLSTELLLLQICDALGTKKEIDNNGIPTWVNQLKDILHEDCTGASLQSLSKEIGVHPVHISRAVPKYFSVSLGEYIRKIKLHQATSLILDSELSL